METMSQNARDDDNDGLKSGKSKQDFRQHGILLMMLFVCVYDGVAIDMRVVEGRLSYISFRPPSS